jgi:hypothetical protein
LDYESEGRRFKSCLARFFFSIKNKLADDSTSRGAINIETLV